MAKRPSSMRAYVDNYPPLRDFLREHEARCNFQLPIAGAKDDPTGFVEHYIFPGGGLAVVIVHANGNGWDIYTPSGSPKVDETIADAIKRLKL